MSEQKHKELVNIGGLWLNKSAAGEVYFSGYLNGARLLIFKNQFKEKENQPDYVMYVTKNEKQSEKVSADEFESTLDVASEPTPPPDDDEPDIPF